MAQVSYGTITITDTTDIARIKNWYLASASASGVTTSTSGWTDDVTNTNAIMTATKQYLWNYEQVQGIGSNGDYITISATSPIVIGRYGQNGTNGVDGNSITSIDEYYKVTDSSTVTSTNPGSTGWTKNDLVVPTTSNKYLWNYQVINYSKTAAEGSYADARIIGVYGDTGPQGPQGNAGINTATVYLYQRATSAPSKPSGTLTYTFSSAKITSGTLGNWKQSIGELTGTNPIWVIAAVASSNGTTDTIGSSEWSTQIKLAENGTDGQPGGQGAAGLNQATVFIYKRATSATAPSATTYTFSNGSFTVPTGWSKTIPASNGNPCYVTSAVAIGNGTTATLTWNTPSILVEDGNDGISPTVTSTSNGVKIVDANGNETYITNGANGQSYYTYVRYSANSNGSDMVATPTSSTKYIGVYSGTSSTVPAYTAFTWSKYVGDPGTPATQYYAFVKYATDANGSNMQDSPDSTHIYVGTYTGTNSSPAASAYKWSKYVGDPGQPATQYYAFIRYATSSTGANMTDTPTASTTYVGTYAGTKSSPTASDYKWSVYVGTDGVSVTAVKEIYYLTTGNAPTAPSAGTTTTSTSTGTNVWTTVVPTYVPNGKYYTSIQTTLSKGTSPISSTAILNNALTDESYRAWEALSISQNANENANGALSIASSTQVAQEALQSKLRKIWVNEITSGSYVAGTYAASGLNQNPDNFDITNPSTYGFNSLLRHTYLSFRYNAHQLVTIGTGINTDSGGISGIAINSPIVNNSNQITGVIKGLELTSTELKFYEPNTSGTQQVDAQLDANGLKLIKGGIEAGEPGQSGFVYLSTIDYPLKDDNASPNPIPGLTINGYTPAAQGTDGRTANDPAWRGIIGNKFGVDKEGNLYASNASIDGTIRVGSGSNVYTIDQADLILDQTKQGTLTYEYIHDNITETVYQRLDGSFYYLNSNGTEVTVTEEQLVHEGDQIKINRLQDGFDDMIDAVRQNAIQANNYLADIEKVVDVLNWVATHGQYGKTTDTEIQNGKFYFTATFTATTDTTVNNMKNYYQIVNNIYVLVTDPVEANLSSYFEGNFNAVTNPIGNPSVNNWYELIGTDKAIANYITTHLVLTNEGLFIQTDDNNYKVQISSNGIYLWNGSQKIATYSDNVILGDTEALHIILGSGELGFYEGLQKVAYINTEKLFITTAEVTTELRIGNFIWKPRHGRLSLIYSPII